MNRVNLTSLEDKHDYTHHQNDWKYPLLLSCMAGASTCIGAGIVFCFSSTTIQNSLPFSLSLAAAVMITVSVISIGPECLEGVIEYHSLQQIFVNGALLIQRIVFFASGCFAYYLLSKLLAVLPEPEGLLDSSTGTRGKSSDDHYDTEEQRQGLKTSDALAATWGDKQARKASPNGSSTKRRTLSFKATYPSSLAATSSQESLDSNDSYPSPGSVEGKGKQVGQDAHALASKRRSWRVAMLLFVSLLCHNFPEGLAVAASTVESPELGLTVAFGILVHNIPEGIAIAVPCIAARPDAPWLAFWLASVSGLAEPIGAMVALSVLRTTELPLGNVLACVAGVMCMVAVLELFPEAFRHAQKGNYQGMIWGTIVGTSIMIATEWYLP